MTRVDLDPNAEIRQCTKARMYVLHMQLGFTICTEGQDRKMGREGRIQEQHRRGFSNDEVKSDRRVSIRPNAIWRLLGVALSRVSN